MDSDSVLGHVSFELHVHPKGTPLLKSLRIERQAMELGRAQRIFLLVLVSVGSSIIYTPMYLKNVFYNPLMEALDATNADLGMLLSAYAITATVCYLPSGMVADKVRVRTLAWVGFTTTALLTYVYAMLPTFTVLMFVFIGMGVTSILIWWGIRFKLVRLISADDEYPKNIGLSYGIYGAAGLIVGLINMWIINMFMDNMQMAVTTLLVVLGTLILILGILSFLFVPRFKGEINKGSSNFDLGELKQVVKSPVIWMAAACMFFVYFYYTGVTYTTPYLSNVMGASLGVVSLVSIIRTYGVTLFSGPIFGFLAKRVGSPSQVIWIGSLVVAVGMLSFLLLPQGPAVAILAAAIVIALGFIANGVFGIVSSQLTEGKVPITIFGTATGILSIIGFLPDTFSSTWFGSMIDNQGNDAYTAIFIILAVSAVLAAASAAVLLQYVKRNGLKLAEAEAEAAARALAMAQEG